MVTTTSTSPGRRKEDVIAENRLSGCSGVSPVVAPETSFALRCVNREEDLQWCSGPERPFRSPY